jgi:hypothetical protein
LLDSVQSKLSSFARGVETGLVDDPLTAVRQIAFHAGLTNHAGNHSDSAKLTSADLEERKGLAFQSGKAAGAVAEFWLVNRAVGVLSGIGHVNALSTYQSEGLKMGASGAVIGALTPVNDKNFAQEKLSAVVSEGASFATFGAVSGRATEYGFLGRPGFRKYWQDAAVYGTAGAVSGAVDAEARSLIMTGNLASCGALAKDVAKNAVLGLGFATFEHGLSQSRIMLKGDESGLKGSAQSTEVWSATTYDAAHGDIRSPILTWLADKNLTPKPPNYEELRQSAWSEKDAVDLSLADWAPQQRPAVIGALRRLAHPQLGQDANMDAFLSRFTTPDLTSKVSAFGESQRPTLAAIEQLKELLSENSAFKGYSVDRLQYDRSLKAELHLPENKDVKLGLDRLRETRRASFDGPEAAEVDKHLHEKLNNLADDIGIPKLKSVNSHASDSSNQVGGSLYLGLGKKPDVNVLSLDHIYHEFTHHAQGLLHGKEKLFYLVKTPYHMTAKKLGLIDEFPQLQAPKNRDQYMSKYIGSDSEKQAWATGLLMRMRAIAAGLPNIQD